MKHILVLKIGSRIGLEYGLGLELWELEGSCLGLRFLNPTYWQVVQASSVVLACTSFNDKVFTCE